MSETSAIDEKKNTSKKPTKSLLNGVQSICSSMIRLGVLIIVGSLGLYTCKVAQANLLPNCLAFAPYTDVTPPIKTTSCDINIVKTDKGNWSTKLEFPLEDNFKIINNTLGFLKNMKNGPNSNVYKLWIATTLQEVISCNFNIITTVYNFLNSSLPETLIIFLGPLISFALFFITAFVNTIYLIILWFYNIYLFFSEKTETGNSTKWKDGDMWGILTWYWSVFYIIIFVLLFGLGLSFFITPLSLVIPIFCMFFPLFMKSKTTETGKSYGMIDTLKNVLKFKMGIIMILAALFIVLSINNNFTSYAAFVAVVLCIILYFFSGIFYQYTPKAGDHSTFGLGTYEQAEKVCMPVIDVHEPSMFEKIEKLFGGSKRRKK